MSNINNEIQVFKNANFGQVRSMMIDGEPWFVGRDVAEILGYKELAKAVRDKVDDDDKGVSVLDTPGGKQEIKIINEAGLYSLILSSKLPSAKDFKRWVTSEVLPTIRKTGSYGKLNDISAPQTLDSLFNIDTLYLIVSKLKEEHDGLKAQLTEKDTTIARLEAQLKNPPLLPEQLDTATDDNRLYTVTEIANEFDVKAVTLNKLLITWKLQHKVGAHYEMCEGIDESKYVHYTFYRGAKAQMKWTGAGRLLIHSRMKQHGYSLVK